MKHLLSFGFVALCLNFSSWVNAEDTTALDIASVKTLKIERSMTEEGRACITCHQQTTPGQVEDWKDSRHAQPALPVSTVTR